MRKTNSPSELGFGKRDMNRLKRALTKVNEARHFRRIQAVLLIGEGYKFQEASNITGLSLSTIYNLVKQYLLNHQIEILADLKRSGRQSVATGSTKARIL